MLGMQHKANRWLS